jgi:protein phosphatase
MLAANIGLCAEQLIQMANDNGGRDNISVILVKIRADFAVPRGWWVRFLSWFK